MAEPQRQLIIVDEGRNDQESVAAAALAERLSSPLYLPADAPDNAIQLVVGEAGLELRLGTESTSRRGRSEPRNMMIDLASIDMRRGSGGLSRKQPIARALGTKVRTIVDATAGTGQDAVLLAALGYHVRAIERSRVLYVMLEDALQRAMRVERFRAGIGERLQIEHDDARQVLAAIDPAPDAVYIDPMFPPKKRASALPRKEIQMLRELVGDDPDADELFVAAMRTAQQRVVVKRPTHAPPLDAKPSLTFTGKLVRYDVYLKQANDRE